MKKIIAYFQIEWTFSNKLNIFKTQNNKCLKFQCFTCEVLFYYQMSWAAAKTYQLCLGIYRKTAGQFESESNPLSVWLIAMDGRNESHSF